MAYNKLKIYSLILFLFTFIKSYSQDTVIEYNRSANIDLAIFTSLMASVGDSDRIYRGTSLTNDTVIIFCIDCGDTFHLDTTLITHKGKNFTQWKIQIPQERAHGDALILEIRSDVTRTKRIKINLTGG